MTAGNQSASCWGLRFVNIATMIADAVSVPILSPAQWSQIDTVLFDLDGTLLDLAFDRRFWRQRVPEAWAQQRAITLKRVRVLGKHLVLITNAHPKSIRSSGASWPRSRISILGAVCSWTTVSVCCAPPARRAWG
jgi:hypothetical protein